MSAREVSSETRQQIRTAISNAFYDARNSGRTMEIAGDDAVEALVPILLLIDENAHRRGVSEIVKGMAASPVSCTIAGWHWYCDVHDTHGNADSEDEARTVADAHEVYHVIVLDEEDGCDIVVIDVAKAGAAL